MISQTNGMMRTELTALLCVLIVLLKIAYPVLNRGGRGYPVGGVGTMEGRTSRMCFSWTVRWPDTSWKADRKEMTGISLLSPILKSQRL